MAIDDVINTDTDEDVFSAVLMTNSLSHQTLELSKGTNVKGLTIQLTEEWLKEKIQYTGTSHHRYLKRKKFLGIF